MMLQRLREGVKDSATLALSCDTRQRQCLGRDDIGSIAVGKQADLALFQLNELRHSGY